MMAGGNSEIPDFQPDRRLSGAYREAKYLDQAGLAALCPDFSELKSEADRDVGQFFSARL